MRYYQYKVKIERNYVGEKPAFKANVPLDVARYLKEVVKLNEEPQEHFIAIHLNIKNKVIGYETVSIGSVNASFANPSDVFRGAILNNAYAIIVAHNHPSGDCHPSENDIQTTVKLAQSGKILGINVLDHIVVGDNEYYSFREHNRMEV